jgi:hypothetical protein
MKAKTVKQALIATKWILGHTGWCRRFYHVDKHGLSLPGYGASALAANLSSFELGGSCLSGALGLVEYQNQDLNRETYLTVHNAIIDDNAKSIPNWNDKPERTSQQVLDLLDKLIEDQK